VTLDDVEWRNSCNRSIILPNSVAFKTDYLKVVEDTPILSAAEHRPKNVVFSNISFMTILAGYHRSESVEVRHSPLASENLTNNQPQLRNGVR